MALWLSRQVMVVPVGPTCDEYAQKVRQQFHDAKFMADIDLDPGCTLNKKIRNAQLAQYNFILVVGEKEKISGTVNIRTRDNKVHGERTILKLWSGYSSSRSPAANRQKKNFNEKLPRLDPWKRRSSVSITLTLYSENVNLC